MHKRALSGIALVILSFGCGSAPAPTGAGAMTPRAPDRELDAAAPVDITAETPMLRWIGERIDAAKSGRRERVRLPLVRRDAPALEMPPFAIATSSIKGPYFWIQIIDSTSASLPPGDWLGWVDGHFTGAHHKHRSGEVGASEMWLPVFEVLARSPRGAEEPAVARVVGSPR